MIKLTVMYPNGAGNTFDMPYYLNTHLPMVRQTLGAALKGVAVEQGVAGGQPGIPAPYVAIAHLTFDSVETFQASFGANIDAIRADVPNYTNTQPVVQISDVKL